MSVNRRNTLKYYGRKIKWLYFRHTNGYLIDVLKGWFCKSQLSDYKQIPIIINNRNQYTFLKMLIDWLVAHGYRNIIVLDNDSSYPPLLEYYRTLPHRIVFLQQNLGYMALMKCDLYQEIKRDYFVYTDADVVPIDECPCDFLDYFLSLLKKDRLLHKVGLSLRIDDLPDCYEHKNKVLVHESKFYRKEVSAGVFEAPVDTTFALYRPFTKVSFYGWFYEKSTTKHYRIGYPYQARHMPWYEDSANPSEESVYYRTHASQQTHWTNKKNKAKTG